jgi:hypothetical protein
MNTLLVIALAVAIPVYALFWHNRPVRMQKEKTTAIEAAFAFRFNPSWLARLADLLTHWVAANLPTKWPAAKIHAHSRKKI